MTVIVSTQASPEHQTILRLVEAKAIFSVSRASSCPGLCLIAFTTDIDLWPHFVSCRLARYLNYLHCLGVLGWVFVTSAFLDGICAL